MADDKTSLEIRTGLPDALRVLLETYPRESWAGHRNFGGLVEFWLDRHMMFRRLQKTLLEDAQVFIDRASEAQSYASRLSRYGSMFVGELHGHHHVEDEHYFPILSARELSLAHGFEILDHDHQALDGHLNAFVERANTIIRSPDAAAMREAVGKFHGEISHFGDFLDRHLIDEEELVVPVILKYGPNGLG